MLRTGVGYVWGITLEDTRHDGAALSGSCGKQEDADGLRRALRMTGTAEGTIVVDMMRKR